MANFRRLTLSAFLAAGVTLATAREAGAVALFWTKTPVNSGSVNTCLSFAESAMRKAGVHSVRVSRMEVAGSRGGAYAAITCINTTPRATAVAMAAGNDLAETRMLSEDLQRRIAGIIKFDDSQ